MTPTNLPIANAANQALAARARLARAGAAMPADPPAAACERCRGIGIIHPSTPSGVNYAAATPCDCQSDRINNDAQRRLHVYGNLPTSQEPSLDHFPPYAASAARAYASNPQSNLLITGPRESDKSRLAAAITLISANTGRPTLYLRASDLVEKNADGEQPALNRAAAAPLLVVDGADDSFIPAWDADKIGRLAERRSSKGAPTAIVAESLKTLHPRLAAAMSRATHLALTPQSPRLNAPLPPAYSDMTLENFDVSPPSASAEERRALASALMAAKRYAAAPKGFLVITGAPGSGKTHLAAAALTASAQALGAHPAYMTCQKTLADIRESARQNKPILGLIESAPLLALDEFGEGAPTEWRKETLASLIKTRHAYALPTIIAGAKITPDAGQGAAGSLFWRLADPRSASAADLTPARAYIISSRSVIQ